MNHTPKLLLTLLLTLLLAQPLAGHALNMCTGADGKTSFQDKPCDTRDAAPQFAPLKAAALNEPLARDTIARFTAAMGARDVAAVQRLLARGFESHLYGPRKQPLQLNAAQFGQFLQRALQAAKSYRIQRSCQRDTAADSATTVAFRCNYSDRMELLNRSAESQGEEFVRVGLEGGEVKLLEVSEPKVLEALRAGAAQASR